jgi:hypothetical protein
MSPSVPPPTHHSTPPLPRIAVAREQGGVDGLRLPHRSGVRDGLIQGDPSQKAPRPRHASRLAEVARLRAPTTSGLPSGRPTRANASAGTRLDDLTRPTPGRPRTGRRLCTSYPRHASASRRSSTAGSARCRTAAKTATGPDLGGSHQAATLLVTAPTNRGGRQRTMLASLRIRRLGVRVPPSAPIARGQSGVDPSVFSRPRRFDSNGIGQSDRPVARHADSCRHAETS